MSIQIVIRGCLVYTVTGTNLTEVFDSQGNAERWMAQEFPGTRLQMDRFVNPEGEEVGRIAARRIQDWVSR